MRLNGWNYIPRGYGLTWDRPLKPTWLRVWMMTPVIDRFAYPLLVRRRIAYLTRHDGWDEAQCDPVPDGWRVEADAPTPYSDRPFEER